MRLDLYQNINQSVVLEAIGIKIDEIERFRGAGVDGEYILIHARTGGGNREDYPNKVLTSNKYYIRDEDDDFDCTYANYYFSIPKELEEKVKATEDKEAKAILGDAQTAIGLIFGDEKAKEEVTKRLEKLK